MASTTRSFTSETVDYLDELLEGWISTVTPGGSYYEELLRQAGLDSSRRVLDVGCGTGRLLARAARREPAAILVGVDVDRESIEMARERARSSPASVEFHLASAERMPFADGFFDTAMAAFVLRGLREASLLRVLHEIRRVLRPGGRVLVLDWVAAGCVATRIATEALALVPFANPHQEGVEHWLAEGGFERLERVREYWTPMGRVGLLAASKP